MSKTIQECKDEVARNTKAPLYDRNYKDWEDVLADFITGRLDGNLFMKMEDDALELYADEQLRTLSAWVENEKILTDKAMEDLGVNETYRSIIPMHYNKIVSRITEILKHDEKYACKCTTEQERYACRDKSCRNRPRIIRSEQ